MKRQRPAPTWVVDYSAARAHAIRWLGDRYLLAKPINGTHYRPRHPAPGILPAVAAEPRVTLLGQFWDSAGVTLRDIK